MSELQALPLLSAKDEIALAKQIEALELAHWRALLSYRPAVDVIARAVAPVLEQPAGALERLAKNAPRRGASRRSRSQAHTSRMTAPAAQQLRALDATRAALRAADAAVLATFAGDTRAIAYRARVQRARDQENAAKQRFVAANLRLVISMARRYSHTLMPLADLIQEGNLGLMRAVERFDYRRGFRFSTYAAWWIRHNLNRSLADRGRLVRIPVHALDDLARVRRVSEQRKLLGGTTPTEAELALELGISGEKLESLRLKAMTTHAASLDRVIGEDDDRTMHDVIAAEPSDPVADIDLAKWAERLPRLLAALPGHEAAILRYRFGFEGGEEMTLRQIGERYDLSRERIRQLERDALERLRHTLKSDARPGDAGVAA